MVLKPLEAGRAGGQGVVIQRAQSNDESDRLPTHGILEGIIGTGQSLSQGSSAPLDDDTPAAPHAWKLHDTAGHYDLAHPQAPTLALAPLVEPFRRGIETEWEVYPGNIAGKTPHSSFAAQVARLCLLHGRAAVPTAHTVVGKSGAPMWEITREGTRNPYAASLFEVQALHRLAAQRGLSYQVGAILLTHGEADALIGHTTYAEEVGKLRRFYCEDVCRITGQKKEPLLILSQQHSFPISASLPPAKLTDDQWRVQGEDERVICACPKYQFEYADKVHLKASGYDRLGEYYGKAYFETAVLQRRFQPLHPLQAAEDGTGSILVQFHVPVAPLRWDELLPQAHRDSHKPWALGRGFEVAEKETGDKVVIQNVSLVDGTPDVVLIKLAQRRLGVPLVLSYAMTQDEDGPACGSAVGRVGQLCDSDETPSASEMVKEVEARRGERTLYCQQGWAERAIWDVVKILDPEQMGDGSEFTICDLSESEATMAVLDRPWSGPGGRVRVACAHNLRNYCVSFQMDVQ